jgi:cyanophycin synthetase
MTPTTATGGDAPTGDEQMLTETRNNTGRDGTGDELLARTAPDEAATIQTPAGGPMRVLESRVYRGPNPYGYRPVVRFKIDLGRIEQHPSDQLDGFTDRLLELMPTLKQHGCSYGTPGGFIRRMREGTWIAHVAEHVAIELQGLAGTYVTYGKTRQVRDEPPGVYNVVYSFLEERVGLLAGWLALRVVNSLLPPELQGIEGLEKLLPRDSTPPLAPAGKALDYRRELEALIRVAQRLALGPTTQSIVDDAKRRGIPAIRLDEYSLVQLGYGKYQQRIRASVTSKAAISRGDGQRQVAHQPAARRRGRARAASAW